jgi:hypothetical protein
MRNSKAAWFRVIIFFIVFIMINYGLTFVLVPQGNYSRMTMREMYSQPKNIDIAFAGASLSQRDINPYIMDKELGCNTFDYAFSGQIYTGTYYSLKELFKYHKPKLIVLTTEPLSYTTKEEEPISYISISLYMKSLLNKVQFYFGSAQDGSYLDRLFVWRGYHAKSIHEVANNIREKLKTSYINYPEPGQVESLSKVKNGYAGKGATRIDPSDSKQGTINYDQLGKGTYDNININDIQEKNVEYLRKIAELCKLNNSRLILLYTPIPAFSVLRVKNYFDFNNEISKIAKDLNVEYYNYNLIKPDLFKSQGDYFSDHIHLNSKGAEVFSNSLAAFLKLRENGEDLSKYFYTPEEYYASINYVTNTWFNWSKDGSKVTLAADSFHGSKVTPEYQFVLTDSETGESYIMRDYDTNTKFTFDSTSYKKYKIRVNARVAGSNDDKLTRYYEEDISK